MCGLDHNKTWVVKCESRLQLVIFIGKLWGKLISIGKLVIKTVEFWCFVIRSSNIGAGNSWNSLQFIHSFYCNMGSDGGLQILFLGASCSKNTHVAAVAMQQKFGTFGLFSIDWKFHNHNWFSYFSEGQRGRYTTSQNRLNWRFD